MLSLNAMVERVCALADDDLTLWERDFVDSIEEKTDCGADTSRLSEKQIAVIERIFNKHFGD